MKLPVGLCNVNFPKPSVMIKTIRWARMLSNLTKAQTASLPAINRVYVRQELGRLAAAWQDSPPGSVLHFANRTSNEGAVINWERNFLALLNSPDPISLVLAVRAEACLTWNCPFHILQRSKFKIKTSTGYKKTNKLIFLSFLKFVE